MVTGIITIITKFIVYIKRQSHYEFMVGMLWLCCNCIVVSTKNAYLPIGIAL